MKLKIPLVRQDLKSVDCGPACVSMVLNYYGIKEFIPDVRRGMKVYKNGTYSPQLGLYFLSKGFRVEIVTLHPGLFIRSDKSKTQAQIKRGFTKLLAKTKKIGSRLALAHYLNFMSKGGRIKVKIPDASDIRAEIGENRPLIALLTSNFLKGESPRLNHHFNIVTGIDSQKIYVNDPSATKRGGRQVYPISDYLYGLYAGASGELDNACLIKIRK